MKILVDAFGGDNAPDEVVKGTLLAKKELDCEVALVGNRKMLLKKFDDLKNFEIIDADYSISMNDEPNKIMRLPNSSILVAAKLLEENLADGFVSAGNSGALVVAATLIAKRIRGIKRCAFAPIIPSLTGFFMLIDSGANVECRPEMLYQFGVMGSAYMREVLGIKNPRVGLLNNGTEPEKGDKLRKSVYEMLKVSRLNFIGNIEAREVPLGVADVVVTDGFTGNIILKMYEGLVKMVIEKFKEVFSSNILTKFAAGLLLPKIKKIKKSMDSKEHGGAPILGCSKPIFKAHGNSDATAIKSAIRLTYKYIKDDVINKISESLNDTLNTEVIDCDNGAS